MAGQQIEWSRTYCANCEPVGMAGQVKPDDACRGKMALARLTVLGVCIVASNSRAPCLLCVPSTHLRTLFLTGNLLCG